MNKRWVKHTVGMGVAAGLFFGAGLVQDPGKMGYWMVLGVIVLMWSEYKFGERQ